MIENALERAHTRRQVLAVGFAASTLLLVGCRSAEHDAAGWRFVDDRKQTVTLRRRPSRIVAYSTAAAALFRWGVTPVGVFGDDPAAEPALAGYPWTESELIGSVYGEIDVAKLRSVKADLIVSRWYPTSGRSLVFGFKDPEQQKAIGAQVPIVGINGHTIATEQIDRFADLVRALGVNTESGAIAYARSEFGKAKAKLSAVARRTENLRIIAVSGDQNTMYVAKVADSGDLSLYAQLGVPLVTAKTSAPYWDRVPWERANLYPADGILYDARSLTLPLSSAKAIPTFAALPAVRANQIGNWRVDTPPSYQAYTSAMNELATTIGGWRRVT
ncbi:MAG: transporter substrate-binding protein [Frankiales bacterium]|nr:transporter substrate-binding protein [Frankiales bacterium]